jgi:hypothetical protein
VAVTLFKRSGETIEWGCKWDGGGLDLYRAIAATLGLDELSSKFPYRVIELLDPYLTQHTGLAKMKSIPEFEAAADEIIRREFEVACSRQRGPTWTNEVADKLLPLLKKYVRGLDKPAKKLRDVIGLCQTVAFAHRTRDNDSQPSLSAVMHRGERETQP